jgi:O-Antigen ligase
MNSDMPGMVETTGAGTRRLPRAPRLERRVPRLDLKRLGPPLAGSVLPFILVLYLALKGGGYDGIVYGEVGVAVWWIVLLGALVGVLPVVRVTRAGWIGLLLLGAFAAWTALGIGWSESAERSAAELGRVATYLGIFTLALFAQGTDGLRRTVNAVGTAIAIVAVLGLLSRLHPSWFPTNVTAKFLPETRGRLNYPLNYWNGLAALISIGLPVVIVAAARSRTLLARGLAAAAVPAMAAAIFYTFSRGGALEVAVALIVLLAMYPRRLELAPTLAISAVGSAILIVAATQRDALEHGLLNDAARSQGNAMLAIALGVCATVGLAQVAVALAARRGLGPRLVVPRRRAARILAVVVAAGLAVALLAGLPGYLSDRWHDFKQPVGAGAASSQRFESTSGNGRYQYWQSAVDADATDPLKGIGPGTYEYWWAEHGTLPGFIRDAHSLYFQTLAEAGIVGLVLVAGFILWILFTAGARARARPPGTRSLLAGAVAGCAAFAAAAGVDWVWQLPVIPAAFLLLAAAILGPFIEDRGTPLRRLAQIAGKRRGLLRRCAIIVLALASLFAIAVPLAAALAIQQSQADKRASQLGAALSEAQAAQSIQPYAASPRIQEALILKLRGDLNGAVSAARAATDAEPTNWRTWFVLSRLETERGNRAAADHAYQQARSLNPRSPLFAR